MCIVAARACALAHRAGLSVVCGVPAPACTVIRRRLVRLIGNNPTVPVRHDHSRARRCVVTVALEKPSPASSVTLAGAAAASDRGDVPEPGEGRALGHAGQHGGSGQRQHTPSGETRLVGPADPVSLSAEVGEGGGQAAHPRSGAVWRCPRGEIGHAPNCAKELDTATQSENIGPKGPRHAAPSRAQQMPTTLALSIRQRPRPRWPYLVPSWRRTALRGAVARGGTSRSKSPRYQ